MNFDFAKQRFDITIPRDQYASWEVLYAKLIGWANKFAFQLEKGVTGYEHWQVRLNLIHRKACAAVKAECIPSIGGHWTLTSNGVHSNPKAFNYVMKEDTRLEGPWTDESMPREKPTLTSQIENFIELMEADRLHPYTHDIIAKVKNYDERHLNYVWDPHYNSGKSVLCEYFDYIGVGEEIPGTIKYGEDIMQFAMSFPSAKVYTFDLPAAMKKEKMNELYTALEMLKNGFLYDKRYHGKKRRINRPQVWVFANNLPKYDLMAPDRWITWYITPDKRLVRYDAQLHPL